jgi:hypothetical protein
MPACLVKVGVEGDDVVTPVYRFLHHGGHLVGHNVGVNKKHSTGQWAPPCGRRCRSGGPFGFGRILLGASGRAAGPSRSTPANRFCFPLSHRSRSSGRRGWLSLRLRGPLHSSGKNTRSYQCASTATIEPFARCFSLDVFAQPTRKQCIQRGIDRGEK